ncbi:uracil-DNA glycosylase family protein [Sulfuricurvum sp.]|uniref:uracil-DNA glycosylase n=1 Tax=Sulfuricurvum sp. TaxID=2025608 RepID=UPI0035685B66
MNSYQNLALLENLYRLKALGYHYVDSVIPNVQNSVTALPDSLASLNSAIEKCYLCDLSKSRTQSMFGFGNPNASIVFVDAFVSAAEDEGNSYYSGRSGTMLRDMIEKVLNMRVEEVFFTHAVKCKPFGFQNPSISECNSCIPFLSKQLSLIKPKLIIALGSDAYELLTNDGSDFERLRGELIPYGDALLIPMYHPMFLLRNPSLKKEAMRDLQTIKGRLG